RRICRCRIGRCLGLEVYFGVCFLHGRLARRCCR
uniref:Defensin-1 n=1 Tax=Papio hamadryas TaxID=9557 RepID=DEF1_PAPHA|nr:RecName: Full=Defensin-1; AltName: Full=PhD1; Contains: RecName: Full=Defensin-2; AltName: Full=PhD2 [Papio hamadryas]